MITTSRLAGIRQLSLDPVGRDGAIRWSRRWRATLHRFTRSCPSLRGFVADETMKGRWQAAAGARA
jgi:hypothetical protein